jgi:hypothetical protein
MRKSSAPAPVSPRRLSTEATRGLEDFFFFGTHFLGLDLEEKPHRAVVDAIESVERGEARNALIVIPRGFYKTSVASAALVWKQYRKVFLEDNPYHRIVIASATLALGEQILKRIEGMLRGGGKNQRLFHEYPKLWSDRTWGAQGSRQPDGIVLAQRITRGEKASCPEPNFWIGSLRRISTGFHADEAFLDDMNNRENVATGFQRAKVQDYFELIQPILVQQDEQGRPPKMTYTCTPWHDDDVRGRIERAEEQRRQRDPEAPRDWEIVKFGVYDEGGAPTFPAKFPVPVVENLRANLATSLFAANYLCDPVGDAVFVHEDWIQFKAPDTFPPLQYGRIAVDPNQHKEAKVSGCYAAIVVAGFDRFGKMYVLEAQGSRDWSSKEFIDVLFELKDRYPDFKLLIEDAHMAHFEHAVRLEEARRSEKEGRPVKLRIVWVPVATNKSKYERYEKLEPRFRARAVVLSDEIHPNLKMELRDELVRGAKARYQDFLDALAIADTGFRIKVNAAGQLAEVPAPKNENPVMRPPTVADFYGGRLPYQ